MGFSCSGFLNRLLRTADFSSVISGRTLSHVASLIAYTFKQTDLTLWANKTSLRFKGEFALATVGNDFFSGASLLRGQPPLGYFLHAMDELSTP
jgi:hypothetical protein